MVHAVVASIALGLVSTLGDFVWDYFRLRHRMGYGLAHGAAICLCIGIAIGLRERKLLAGTIGGPIIGLLAAAGFYVLRPWLGYWGMFPMWMFFWLLFALLQDRLGAIRGPNEAVARGLAAALLSGLAFYAISGIWTRPSPGGPDYIRHFLAWTVAFLPGFSMLFVGRRAAGSPRQG